MTRRKTKTLQVLTVLTAFAAVSILAGCNGKTVIVNWDIDADNNSIVRFTMDAEGIDFTTETKQDAQPVFDLKLPASGAGTVLDAATKLQPDTLDKLKLPKLPTKGSTEPVSNTNEPINETVETTWNTAKVFSTNRIAHNRPFFRLGVPGDSFGPSMLITDELGNEFFIPDTRIDFGNHSNQFFFNGRAHEKTFDGNASLFWYKTGAKTITIHYNKPN